MKKTAIAYYDETNDGECYELPVTLYTSAGFALVKMALNASYADLHKTRFLQAFSTECKRAADGRLVLVKTRDHYVYDGDLKHAVSSLSKDLSSGIERVLRSAGGWSANKRKRSAIPDKDLGGFTIKQACCLYDLLQSRPYDEVTASYGEDVYKSVIGQPDNIMTVMRRKTIVDEMNALRNEYEKSSKAIADERKAVNEALNKKQKALVDEFFGKIDKLKEALEELQAN